MADTVNPLVVVGVDGSEGSQTALRWAADYTRRAEGRLLVMGAWQYPTMYYGYAVAIPEDDLAAEKFVLARLTDKPVELWCFSRRIARYEGKAA